MNRASASVLEFAGVAAACVVATAVLVWPQAVGVQRSTPSADMVARDGRCATFEMTALGAAQAAGMEAPAP